VGLRPQEAKRKVLHIAVGGFALLLRWLTWPEAALLAVAALLFNWRLLPAWGGRGLWRDSDHGRGYSAGILLYPLSVLGLVLAFRHDLWKAAAVWAVMAAGDGMASLIGHAAGGPRLPWNRDKGWIGFGAFVFFGAAAAWAAAAWTLRPGGGAATAPWLVAGCLVLAGVCGVVESLPWNVDDNLTVPVAGALVMVALGQARAGTLLAEAGLADRVLAGLAVSAVLAGVAWRARALDAAGAASTVVIGTAITAGLGLRGLAVMATFFVVGTAATRLGQADKARRGLAQERGGVRGWRNAWANGAVPAALALMALLAPADTRGLWVIAYAASVATAAADTCASEIGKAYGRHAVLITTLRPVPPGTEGGISAEGTLGGLAGAVVVAAAGAAAGLYGAGVAALAAAAGLVGCLAESLLGTVSERRGWMGNDLLNAVNTAIGALVALLLAKLLPLSG
jgi:uncharacterized protein (TIGR00297 family)